MQCTLLVPHLFWPRETADQVERGLELPALSKILSRADAIEAPPLTLEAWLCQAFEVEKQQDWPVAPLTATLDGLEVEDKYWLRADPVHIKIERDRLLLVENGLFELSLDDAQAFAGVLNKHFAGEVTFHAPSAKRWYVTASGRPDVTTRNPGEVAGRDVKRYLPSGADAMKWHRIFNEAQMLLHEHPLNEARESRGEAVVNSIWFWGGGTRTRVHGRHFSDVWSDDAVATSLATLAEAAVHEMPASADAWLRRAGMSKAASHLIVLTGLSNATRYGDAHAWRTRAQALDTEWLGPLIAALRDGRLTQLALVTPGESASWRFEVSRLDLVKFWRGRKSLAQYA